MQCKITKELNKADVHVNESNIHNLYICLYINLSRVHKGSLSLVLGSQWTPQITGSTFRISLQPYWQISDGFFNRPIMACTQILVHW